MPSKLLQDRESRENRARRKALDKLAQRTFAELKGSFGREQVETQQPAGEERTRAQALEDLRQAETRAAQSRGTRAQVEATISQGENQARSSRLNALHETEIRAAQSRGARLQGEAQVDQGEAQLRTSAIGILAGAEQRAAESRTRDLTIEVTERTGRETQRTKAMETLVARRAEEQLTIRRLQEADAARTRPGGRELRAEAAQLSTYSTLPVFGPWDGFQPDLSPYVSTENGCRDVVGLMARPDPTNPSGEVLMSPPGYEKVDKPSDIQLPLGDDAAQENDIIMLTQFLRANASGAQTGDFDLTPIAISAGNGTTETSCEVYIVDPSGNTWEQVAYSTTGATPTGLKGGRDNMFDYAVMESGSSTRGGDSDGPIDQPCIVFTNNLDEVQVYPCDAAAGGQKDDFSHLTVDTDLELFLAKSVEAFNGRLYFLNTSEAGTRHRTRLRRTAVFNADPDNANVGSGALDLREFSTDGLRALAMQDVLVCYFEDGVAFIRPSGNPTSPDARQILDQRRGLLGTFAVTALDSNTHFGIFDDGWFFLDSSGRWTEAGVVEVDGKRMTKWKDYFYNILDYQNRGRLVVEYDPNTNMILITIPKTGDVGLDRVGATVAENQEVWYYDFRSNRVWPQRYRATTFGFMDPQTQESLQWGDASGTWSAFSGSWASYAVGFGNRSLVHGDPDGNVYIHNPDLTTRDGVAIAYLYESHESPGRNPRELITGDRITVEAIGANSPNATAAFYSGGASESGTMVLSGITSGEAGTISNTFHFSRTHMGFKVSGTGPVALRSFTIGLFSEGTEVYSG